MNRFLAPSVALLCVLGLATAADEIKSGLQPGESAPAFNVRDITGPNQGKTLCYRCANGARPVVCVFAREVNDGLSQLVKEIEGKVDANSDKKMAAFVVMLTEDPDKLEPALKSLAKDKEIKKTPLTLIEGAAGPKEYKIAKNADVTVMMWVGLKVKVNHTFAKGELTKDAISKVVDDTAQILK